MRTCKPCLQRTAAWVVPCTSKWWAATGTRTISTSAWNTIELSTSCHPNMSGEYAYRMTPAEGWYDITPLDFRSLGYEMLQWFQYNYGFELEEGLVSGYVLEYMGPEYQYNHYVLKFGMYRGMDNDSEEIDTYAEYAVDLTYTYKMDPYTGNYQVIGDGVPFTNPEEAEMIIASLYNEDTDGAVG